MKGPIMDLTTALEIAERMVREPAGLRVEQWDAVRTLVAVARAAERRLSPDSLRILIEDLKEQP